MSENTETGATQGGKTAAVVEMSIGSSAKAREPMTGAEVKDIDVFTQSKIAIDEFKKMALDNGRLDIVARIEGKKYEPSNMQVLKNTAKKVQSALVTVGWALLPGGVLVLLWEGMRFAIPSTRKWPGFVKYDAKKDSTPRLSVPKP